MSDLLSRKLTCGFSLLTNGKDRLSLTDAFGMAERLAATFPDTDKSKLQRLGASLLTMWNDNLQPFAGDADSVDVDGFAAAIDHYGEGFVRDFSAVTVSCMDIADAEETGVLSLAAFTQLGTSVFGVTAQAAAAMFAGLDGDADGSVARADIEDAILDYWTGQEADEATVPATQ